MEEKKEWVDFKLVKAEVSMQSVLDHYGVTGLTRSGHELRGQCPIHRGQGNKKEFTVNTTKNAFKCFFANCGVRGNVLDFVAAMEHCSIRDAALKLQEWFKIGETPSADDGLSEPKEVATDIRRGIYCDEKGLLCELIARATDAEDFTELVVYRELSGEYEFWVSPASAFTGVSEAGEPIAPLFTLVKAL